MKLASYIDHTVLKPTCTLEDISTLCEEAMEFEFAAVCVPPFVLHRAKQVLKQTPVKLATVIGFPMGYSALEAKLTETKLALAEGADELDVVINLIALKNDQWNYLEKEMKELVSLVHASGKWIKVIIETGVLTNEEITHCCHLYGKIGVDFIKTSTGYSEKGASVEAVKLIRANLPANVRIKASGGIKTYDFAMQLIDAGASRIGSSAGIAIIKNTQPS